MSEFRGFAVTRLANDGCTGIVASTAASTTSAVGVVPTGAKKTVAIRGETNSGPIGNSRQSIWARQAHMDWRKSDERAHTSYVSLPCLDRAMSECIEDDDEDD